MSTQTKIPLAGLLEGYETALTGMGYSITTKMLFVRRAELLVRKYLTEGPDYLDQEIINDYVKEIDDRYFHGTKETL